jgi:hypothetical protein
MPGKILKILPPDTIWPYENGLKAIEGNPHIPSFYADMGWWYAENWNGPIGWDLFDIGYALGGGVKGDVFDLQVKPRERELLSRYPDFF